MNEKQQRRRIWGMWLGSLAFVFATQALVIAALFIPQNRLLQDLETRDAEEEEMVISQARNIEILRHARSSLRDASEVLRALNLPDSEIPPRAILRSLEIAREEQVVDLMGFFRPQGVGADVPYEDYPVWNVQLEGPFEKTVHFLNQIEQEGVLLETNGFRMIAGRDEDRVRVEVSLSSHTEETLAQRGEGNERRRR